RINECLALRVKDIDFDRRQLMVRRGKGARDRPALFPERAREGLRKQLALVEERHRAELDEGRGHVDLPDALRTKFPNPSRSLASSRPGAQGGSRLRRAGRGPVGIGKEGRRPVPPGPPAGRIPRRLGSPCTRRCLLPRGLAAPVRGRGYQPPACSAVRPPARGPPSRGAGTGPPACPCPSRPPFRPPRRPPPPH